ncbi:EPIDERMAL PATTERNING FACTOR-like protein 6 [Acorus calamus]|uniref:Epidermal patterning factor-like protein n=1 Tax=Acorus calamus TaxID=4465 RepID=A0AAV9EEB7_ACOCL|nr:EPIDERMAL PATTERNING FACTOR-like protein 6 [Acorus calamus]
MASSDSLKIVIVALLILSIKSDGLGFANVDGINSVGSEPPNCFDKCLGCIPCEPVLVAQKGSEGEYYPEEWKCKCGNKIFNP